MNGETHNDEPGVVLVGSRGSRGRWRRKRIVAPAAVVTFLLLALGAAWLSRERIAGNVIEGQLAAYDIPATYKIEQIGGRTQIVRDVVVGNPARPDLTVQRAEVQLVYRLGTPKIGRITLINPRLYGRLINGRVSFGSLDKALYRDTGKPPGLPELDVAIRDGRALIRTPYGPVGAKIDGAGLIADGFAGTLAVAAPGLAGSGCTAHRASAFGKVTTSKGQPHFAGPLRLAELTCAAREVAVRQAVAEVNLGSDAQFKTLTGNAVLTSGPARYASYAAAATKLLLRGNWKDGLLDERHRIELRGLTAPQARAAVLSLEGSLRAGERFARIDLRSDVEGSGLRPGPALQQAMAQLARAGQGTLAEPLARKFAAALGRESRGSALAADLSVRRSAGMTSIIVPRAELTGGSGARILSLSRVEARAGASMPPRLSGNIATGGPDMPEINGRMERTASGGAVFRLTMAPYSAGTSSLALPQLSVAQAPDGAIGFAGRVLASGPLPGGFARGLAMPVSGRWAPNGALSVWRSCADVAFDQLRLANLTLERRGLTLCPPPGRAIVERGAGSSGRALRIAAGTPRLDVAGSLGATPIRIASGPVGFAYPGLMTARAIAIALGPATTASHFTVSNLTASLGGRDIGGRFDGADVRLARVPLDLRDSRGNWRYAGGVLTLSEGDFRLVDRQAKPRFNPLVAEGGTLTMRDNRITAAALLSEPTSGRAVTAVTLAHNLGSGAGHADLKVGGLTFDAGLQPAGPGCAELLSGLPVARPLGLSCTAFGVISNARGTVTGTGRIDWSADGVTSTGDFSSDGLDFAAAFGPVKAARGTVHFTDLIGLTTAPGQTLQVASVNPGIEVVDGEFTFQLKGGRLLAVEGGNWPFMGGRLILKRVDLNFGAREARRYVFEIVGLDAAAFIARFELPNISATGLFDGTVPIVFDENGTGRIEGGLLTSRAPGGNVSYVGELTYKDLSPIANFAFDALRSLDYRRMTIGMNGSLTGEIVTNVNIEQVSQGAGAKRNLITRALSNLPIEFRINIRAPFYQLITSFKSLRDPAAVRDPRDLGLLSSDGTRLLKPAVTGEEVKPKVTPQDIIPGAVSTAKPPPVQN